MTYLYNLKQLTLIKIYLYKLKFSLNFIRYYTFHTSLNSEFRDRPKGKHIFNFTEYLQIKFYSNPEIFVVISLYIIYIIYNHISA